MTCTTRLAALVLILSTFGCRPDYKRTADDMVEANYLKSEQRCNAIPFFEDGGRYFDDDANWTIHLQEPEHRCFGHLWRYQHQKRPRD